VGEIVLTTALLVITGTCSFYITTVLIGPPLFIFFNWWAALFGYNTRGFFDLYPKV